jgi:SAM-dependent methyltransferase
MSLFEKASHSVSQSEVDQKHYAFQSNVFGGIDRANMLQEFDDKARWYRCFLKYYLPKDKGASILDLPCGHGNFLYFLGQEGYTNTLGIDLDPGRIAIAQALGLAAKQADGLAYISGARDIDLIVSLDFLEHIERESIPNLLAAFYLALRSGGMLIVRMPVTDSLLGAHDLHADFTHKWALNSGILAGMLRQGGFSSVIFKDERPVPYKLINVIRLGLFHVASFLTNLWFRLLGFPPRVVWSTSGWYIAKKS